MFFVKMYLWINAVLYAVFALWCSIKADATASFLGYQFSETAGKIEYLTVYGGLELGLSFFFIFSVVANGMVFPAIYFSCFLYGCLVLFRILSLLYFGWSGINIFIIAILEFLLLCGAISSWYYIQKNAANGQI